VTLRTSALRRTAAWLGLAVAAAGLAACSPDREAPSLPSPTASTTTTTSGPARDPWADKERLNVLVLGSDGGPNRHGERTDVVIVASIDTKTGNTVLIGMPRNMQYVRFKPGTRMARRFPNGFPDFMFGIYTYAASNPEVMRKSKDPGAALLKQTVGYNLGIKIDYYALINMKGFRDIIEAVGGVDIRVAEPLVVGFGGIYLQPRLYKNMGSYDTLWYARSRKNTTDYSRMARQRCVLTALVRQVKPQTLLSKLPKLTHNGVDSLRTDIPASRLPAFAVLANRVSKAEIMGITLGPPVFSGASPDWARIKKTVADAIETSATAKRKPNRHKRTVEGGQVQSTDAVCRFS
jgi:polyisoprenyl-teichoic acid--peptidoglycan teichoic acid transferase